MKIHRIVSEQPLIDEYSLKKVQKVCINILVEKDLTLFEVSQTVQKVRAEVDPEVELIFENSYKRRKP